LPRNLDQVISGDENGMQPDRFERGRRVLEFGLILTSEPDFGRP
jgi:hypothetical protein